VVGPGARLAAVGTIRDAGGKRSRYTSSAGHRSSFDGNGVCKHVKPFQFSRSSRLHGAMLEAAVDTIGAGVFLVRGDGGILHANASGKAILRDGGVLREIDGAAVPTDIEARQLLLDALAELVESRAHG
jgi:hypothetical protein